MQGAENTALTKAPPEAAPRTATVGIENDPQDPDLRRLVEAWPTLPDPVRAGIVAMVEATAGA